MDLAFPEAEFASGAAWNFCGPYLSGPNQGDPRFLQVLECVWPDRSVADGGELPAVMGACYFVNREWFLQWNALRHFRLWGGDEQELSLKAWLSGGEIRLLKNVRIGHRFRKGPVSPSFKMLWHELYNKLFILHTCLPPETAKLLQRKLVAQRAPGRYGSASQAGMALKRLNEDWHLVETARAHNERLFTRDFTWLCQKFGINPPAN